MGTAHGLDVNWGEMLQCVASFKDQAFGSQISDFWHELESMDDTCWDRPAASEHQSYWPLKASSKYGRTGNAKLQTPAEKPTGVTKGGDKRGDCRIHL